MKKTTAVLITSFFILSCCCPQSSAKTQRPAKTTKEISLTAQSVIVVDVKKNKTLYSKNIHARRAPASTVKILAALVALEELGANTPVKISKNASETEPSKVWLPEGAVYNSLDLIKAILISSANDASVALAQAVSDTEGDFAKKMNKKARLLGARNSNFTNASGLPSKNQYSTVYDLYRITKAALKNSTIYNIMKKKKEKIKGTKGREIILVNHNKLVFRKSYPLVLVKTGYTKSARHCYAGKIYLGKREYVFAFLSSIKPWSDIDRIIEFIKDSRM